MAAPASTYDRLTSKDLDHIEWVTADIGRGTPPSQDELKGTPRVGQNVITAFISGVDDGELHDTVTAMIDRLEAVLRETTAGQKQYKRDGIATASPHLSDKELSRIQRQANRDARKDISILGRGWIRRIILGDPTSAVDERIAAREEQAKAKRRELSDRARELKERSSADMHKTKLGRQAIAAQAEYDKAVAEQAFYDHSRELALRRPTNMRVRLLMARAAHRMALAHPDEFSFIRDHADHRAAARRLVARAEAARKRIKVPSK